MSNKALFSGAWCPSVIPFKTSGEIDYDALQKHFDRLAASGTDGILLMGTIGEFVTMSLSERESLLKKARKMTKLPMIAHVSTTCVDDMVHLADIAYAEGYEAVMALPHYYYAQTPKQLYEYFIDLNNRFKGKWLIYNFPARTGCDVDAALVLKLAKECPNFVGIKDTVDCSSHTRLIVRAMAPVRKDFSIFAGYDEYFVPNLMNGGAGVLSGLNNVVPELFTKIKTAYQANNLAEVAALHEEIGRLSGIYAIGDDFVTTIKTTVARKYKYLEPISRNYGGKLNPEQLAAVDSLFDIK
ncbi:dihydrodipicolinate synthase family protein [Budviciaceae bacterium CWB-B4]|uniref:Dihydrodipicolinate synthase family protein n=1 Tax=Limnobaculum xujianqingii TaxID=2738837 RepID=A0A9D7AHM9_9GAMM|nr:dihydrodipicolinate synthase family protein [Limnobaculum xujianqingii]MBK5072788.1 dihydrodipicolinate synthase family protein [Limnobaculum xujianqingii]MBK5176097.1 dihydrodipicolinate synthase family protein [Limnobaculum xujianqingii]